MAAIKRTLVIQKTVQMLKIPSLKPSVNPMVSDQVQGKEEVLKGAAVGVVKAKVVKEEGDHLVADLLLVRDLTKVAKERKDKKLLEKMDSKVLMVKKGQEAERIMTQN